ncbi:hypothetical protein [Streptomyces sp. HD]|nr:hypothetical protein [Streptomyces sp. HD]MDC0765619.1 hypothetical protein [Streptomyces sp. HD]
MRNESCGARGIAARVAMPAHGAHAAHAMRPGRRLTGTTAASPEVTV